MYPKADVLLAFVLFFLAGEALLLAAAWRLLGPRPGQKTVPAGYATAVLFGQALLPLAWVGLRGWWDTLSDPHRADVMSALHLSFVLPVFLFQVLILVGGVLGWGWVRSFWPRVVHLAAIALVVSQAAIAHDCPFTAIERDLRGGYLRDLEGASIVGQVCNPLLYQRVRPDAMLWQYAIFGAAVVGSWYLVRPRWPGLGGDPR